jgi:hypothetical protein
MMNDLLGGDVDGESTGCAVGYFGEFGKCGRNQSEMLLT